MQWMREGNPWASDARLAQDAQDKMKRRDDGQWTWKHDPALSTTGFPNLSDPVLNGRYWKAIETISCPVLEVRGAESAFVSDDVVERMIKTSATSMCPGRGMW